MEVGKLGFSDMLRLPAYKNEKFFFRQIRGKMNMNHEHGDYIITKRKLILFSIGDLGWRLALYFHSEEPTPTKEKIWGREEFPKS